MAKNTCFHDIPDYIVTESNKAELVDVIYDLLEGDHTTRLSALRKLVKDARTRQAVVKTPRTKRGPVKRYKVWVTGQSDRYFYTARSSAVINSTARQVRIRGLHLSVSHEEVLPSQIVADTEHEQIDTIAGIRQWLLNNLGGVR